MSEVLTVASVSIPDNVPPSIVVPKDMYIRKRDKRKQPVCLAKITARNDRLTYGLNRDYVDPNKVTEKLAEQLCNGMSTSELDELSAEICAHLSSTHPDFGILAGRIAVSNHHKNTPKLFTDVIHLLYHYIEPRTGENAGLIDLPVYEFIQMHADRLNAAIIHSNDFSYEYFAFKTLEKSYLLKINGRPIERPQHLLMRVACGIHYKSGDIEAVLETYRLLSFKWYTHATPTLFNAGTRCPQLSSCFLLTMQDDSIEGIYDTLKQTAMISKQAGGIGVAVGNIRASGSYIKGTNGTANGLVPMLRVYNTTARYVDQGNIYFIRIIIISQIIHLTYRI